MKATRSFARQQAASRTKTNPQDLLRQLTQRAHQTAEGDDQMMTTTETTEITTSTAVTEETTTKPMSLWARVQEGWKAHHAHVAELQAQAEEAAAMRGKVVEPLPTLQRREGQLQAQLSGLAAKRAAIAREVEDAQALAELGIATGQDEADRLAAVEVEIAPLAQAIAVVQARIAEINRHATEWGMKESSARLEMQKQPRDLIVQEREAVLDRINRARIAYLAELERAVGWNNRLPQGALDGSFERTQWLGGPSVDAQLPEHMRGLRPIGQNGEDLTFGVRETANGLTQPWTFPLGAAAAQAKAAGVELDAE